ncbi:VOC family protein [Martelella endophytica]|uniref:Bleomycin resistance protein n=1 Tax=Martelella endophytica TaxID=1486262 RepID=A0A0D5LST2_MAREN|nr:VOC family protein [Martelella endophytica]AJY47264.1 bleomycin resistance protein [Martelella endophytica]
MKSPVFINTLIFVADLDRATRFYRDVLGQTVLESAGDFVRLENGLALHTGRALEETTFGESEPDSRPYGRRNLVLYFESDEIEAMLERVSTVSELIHPIETQAWGQRVFRFHDPDGHIVEIGEPM